MIRRSAPSLVIALVMFLTMVTSAFAADPIYVVVTIIDCRTAEFCFPVSNVIVQATTEDSIATGKTDSNGRAVMAINDGTGMLVVSANDTLTSEVQVIEGQTYYYVRFYVMPLTPPHRHETPEPMLLYIPQLYK